MERAQNRNISLEDTAKKAIDEFTNALLEHNRQAPSQDRQTIRYAVLLTETSVDTLAIRPVDSANLDTQTHSTRNTDDAIGALYEKITKFIESRSLPVQANIATGGDGDQFIKITAK